MSELPQKLRGKLSKRKEENALRKLTQLEDKIDFSSNDYLGFAKSKTLYARSLKYLEQKEYIHNGSTGSRLLTGNNELFTETEQLLAKHYGTPAALIFNSGYDANMGIFSSLLQRGDLVLYDEFVHASIRDGISSSNASHLKFKHNDLNDLRDVLHRFRTRNDQHDNGAVYIATESVFSMDGDSPDLQALVSFCEQADCYLILDEAHAGGLFGENGAGKAEMLGLSEKIFARIVTFGKALGTHGAAVLGSGMLKEYLLNFARSLIYTTALSPHTVATIFEAHQLLKAAEGVNARNTLRSRIDFFRARLEYYDLLNAFKPSNSAIQSCVVPGNSQVKKISQTLLNAGYDVRPILSPTVPSGEERLRFCLHSFNTENEIDLVLKQLALSLKTQ